MEGEDGIGDDLFFGEIIMCTWFVQYTSKTIMATLAQVDGVHISPMPCYLHKCCMTVMDHRFPWP